MPKEELSHTKFNTAKQEFHRHDLDEHKLTTHDILGDQLTATGILGR
jgi:hypothetical protein